MFCCDPILFTYFGILIHKLYPLSYPLLQIVILSFSRGQKGRYGMLTGQHEGWDPRPLQQKHRGVLTTGPPEKAQMAAFYITIFLTPPSILGKVKLPCLTVSKAFCLYCYYKWGDTLGEAVMTEGKSSSFSSKGGSTTFKSCDLGYIPWPLWASNSWSVK